MVRLRWAGAAMRSVKFFPLSAPPLSKHCLIPRRWASVLHPPALQSIIPHDEVPHIRLYRGSSEGPSDILTARNIGLRPECQTRGQAVLATTYPVPLFTECISISRAPALPIVSPMEFFSLSGLRGHHPIPMVLSATPIFPLHWVVDTLLTCGFVFNAAFLTELSRCG
ncbi:hypothetical protein P691DRAFT_14021 [Macrolepiota fuliginosa MF-IS2]|uniref:Uncharacterized protein n=1 Tax=Macrolepiota fuliginosa MF-IS2 TaxID=1400762 RepID=A0A9P5XQH4_9AGAR|nr:hypothetical protein P691DRAFT_14021 [Macrolepiota fuliginosa MF-IS2]